MWCRIPLLSRTALQIEPRISAFSASLYHRQKGFHSSTSSYVIKPFLLADIGEGIRECEVIQWFVEPGARVEQFDKLCEVQSDKASVEITSRYDGVVRKLHYEAGDMAIVGKPLVDIDIEGEDLASEPPKAISMSTPNLTTSLPITLKSHSLRPVSKREPKHGSLATPAVRRMCKEYGIEVGEMAGTGKDGRVLKEDIIRFLERTEAVGGIMASSPHGADSSSAAALTSPGEQVIPLTLIQSRMFISMTKSLSIPHFLFTDEVKLDALIRARSRINSKLPSLAQSISIKLTYMPFFIKAVSLALKKYPIINSRLDMDGEKPTLVMRPQHNIGVAMDTPSGLLVPNIKNVEKLGILEIARELQGLQAAGAAGKLTPADLKGGTITISNIGNIGGAVVSPVIVNSEVAILGIGKARKIPLYDETDNLVPTTIINFSWCADHRVIDGATMARMAGVIKGLLEEPELMLIEMA